MNERQLFRALGDVDDSLLEAAERLPHRKKPRHTGLWIAACLCLAALSLAAPYVALFTKGASSADPKAAVSTQDAPGATEAAPRASSDRNGSIQEFAPETQATAPHTQVNTAPRPPHRAIAHARMTSPSLLPGRETPMTAPRVSSPAQTGKPSPYLSAKSSASVPGPCCPVWNSQRSGRASSPFPSPPMARPPP